MRGPKLIYKHVWFGNVQANIPKNYPRVVEKGPFKNVQDFPR